MPSTDLKFCGRCGSALQLANGTIRCSNSECRPTKPASKSGRYRLELRKASETRKAYEMLEQPAIKSPPPPKIDDNKDE